MPLEELAQKMRLNTKKFSGAMHVPCTFSSYALDEANCVGN
jgi:hypothetical protein